MTNEGVKMKDNSSHISCGLLKYMMGLSISDIIYLTLILKAKYILELLQCNSFRV